MNILEKIIAHKKNEVTERKEIYPVKLLERSVYFNTAKASLKNYLTRTDKSGVIAEFKRKSPSKGAINKYASIEQVSIGFMQAGASALSILTDKDFFGGSGEDLKTARKFNYCPILRKDFVIDEYQIIEARSLGADAILLIASVLSPRQIAAFTRLAHSIHLEVLLEVHHKDELTQVCADVDVLGVNNRNLSTFETTVEQSLSMIAEMPKNVIKISESGIKDADTAYQLLKAGFNGFLIGEQFMKHTRPEEACASFIQQLNVLRNEN